MSSNKNRFLSIGFFLVVMLSALMAQPSLNAADSVPQWKIKSEALEPGRWRIVASMEIPANLHQTKQVDFFGFEFEQLPPAWSTEALVYPPSTKEIDGFPAYQGKVNLERILIGPPGESLPAVGVKVSWQLCYDDGTCLFPQSSTLALPSPNSMVDIVSTDNLAINLPLLLLLAFLGGLILNVMPCVLPVLSLKVLSLAQAAGESKKQRMHHALLTVAGIVASMLVLAGLIIGLQGAGQLAGWGFQFQQPLFTAFMVILMLSFALNLFGVWQIAAPVVPGATPKQKKSLLSSFANGALTVVLATPCSAPFLGTAMGAALASPWWVIILAFIAAGLGLATPFFLMATIPAAKRLIPKPGPWMERFRQILGFALLATAIWLASVFGQQSGADALMVLAWIALAFSVLWWVVGLVQQSTLTRWLRRLIISFGLVGLVVTAIILLLPTKIDANPAKVGLETTQLEAPWERFDDALVSQLLAQGQGVFIDFGAAWCLTCQVNEAGVLADAEVLAAFAQAKVRLFKGDWTKPDPVIEAWLRRYGRAGVPFYLLALPGSEPRVLPELLDKGTLISDLK